MTFNGDLSIGLFTSYIVSGDIPFFSAFFLELLIKSPISAKILDSGYSLNTSIQNWVTG